MTTGIDVHVDPTAELAVNATEWREFDRRRYTLKLGVEFDTQVTFYLTPLQFERFRDSVSKLVPEVTCG